MKRVLALLVVLAAARSVSAEVVFSNLNGSVSAAVGSGFTNYAQRFTTVSAGSGFQLDLNLVSLSGSQSYAVELWSADVAGTNLSALLAVIGSGSVSATDRTAVTTFNATYGLAASTRYFIKLVTDTGSLGVVLGPSGSTALNSIVRYGVGALPNTDPNLAIAMRLEVVTVPEPAGVGLASLVAAMLAAAAAAVRRRAAAGRREGASRPRATAGEPFAAGPS